MKNGHKVVLCLTQKGPQEKMNGFLTDKESSGINHSENSRQTEFSKIVGNCATMVFRSKTLKGTTFESIDQDIKNEGVDFIELSTLKEGNISKHTIRKIVKEYPKMILLPTGTWVKTNGGYYLNFLELHKDTGRYLQGSITEDLEEIRKILGI